MKFIKQCSQEVHISVECITIDKAFYQTIIQIKMAILTITMH